MDTSKRVDFIKNWIIDYVQSMPKKASTLVVGVSGGIDSAVVSTISSMTGLKKAAIEISYLKSILNSTDEDAIKSAELIQKYVKLNAYYELRQGTNISSFRNIN